MPDSAGNFRGISLSGASNPWLDKLGHELIRVIAGHVSLSGQMFEQLRAAEDAWAELERIATHYDEATPEQRARLDAFHRAVEERDW